MKKAIGAETNPSLFLLVPPVSFMLKTLSYLASEIQRVTFQAVVPIEEQHHGKAPEQGIPAWHLFFLTLIPTSSTVHASGRIWRRFDNGLVGGFIYSPIEQLNGGWKQKCRYLP
jgi:hypothetical protein